VSSGFLDMCVPETHHAMQESAINTTRLMGNGITVVISTHSEQSYVILSLTPRGHLAMSIIIFGCYSGVEKVVLGHLP
jgi:hypothetical protein